MGACLTSKSRNANTQRVSPSSPLHQHPGVKQQASPGDALLTGTALEYRSLTVKPTYYMCKKHTEGTGLQKLLPRAEDPAYS